VPAHWEVEVELRCRDSVRHVWLVEPDRITVGDEVRLDDDGYEDELWRVAATYGRRLVHPPEGIAVFAPSAAEESS
jgi:hypothetical protein